MAIVINEFEVTPTENRPEQAAPVTPAPGATATDLVDLAQRLAQLEERALRLETN